MPQVANKHTILATFDISRMYTNINNNLGQDSIKFWPERYPESKTRNIPNEFILKALKIVLEYTTFTYERKHTYRLERQQWEQNALLFMPH